MLKSTHGFKTKNQRERRSKCSETVSPWISSYTAGEDADVDNSPAWDRSDLNSHPAKINKFLSSAETGLF